MENLIYLWISRWYCSWDRWIWCLVWIQSHCRRIKRRNTFFISMWIRNGISSIIWAKRGIIWVQCRARFGNYLFRRKWGESFRIIFESSLWFEKWFVNIFALSDKPAHIVFLKYLFDYLVCVVLIVKTIKKAVRKVKNFFALFQLNRLFIINREIYFLCICFFDLLELLWGIDITSLSDVRLYILYFVRDF